MLLQILSGSSLVLGLYLAIVHLVMRDTSPTSQTSTYHIGCYDQTNPLNHSVLLEQKLTKIQQTNHENINLNMYHSRAMTPTFEKDVRQIAKTFQMFLDQYYKAKGSNDYNINYYNQLRFAKNRYHQCAGQNLFYQQDCLAAWERYSKSLGDIQESKKVVGELIQAKEKNQVALSSILLKIPNLNEDQVQNNFKVKINQLITQKDHTSEILAQLRMSKNKYKADLSEIEADVDQLKKILYDCLNNLQLVIYCKNINQKIRQIEDNAPKMQKSELQARISKKMVIINGLEINIKRSRRIGELTDIRFLEEELASQKNEMGLLEYRVEHFQTKEESRCAMCSQERIGELRRNISALQRQKIELEAGHTKLQLQITKMQLKLSDLKKQIETTQQERQLFMINQFCLDKECKKKQQHSMQQKKILLNELKKQIINKEIELRVIQSSVAKGVKGLELYLREFDKISDCIVKKEYFYELKKKEPKERGIDQNIAEVQKTIAKQLSDFQL